MGRNFKLGLRYRVGFIIRPITNELGSQGPRKDAHKCLSRQTGDVGTDDPRSVF
jgi:hypothetical protein